MSKTYNSLAEQFAANRSKLKWGIILTTLGFIILTLSNIYSIRQVAREKRKAVRAAFVLDSTKNVLNDKIQHLTNIIRSDSIYIASLQPAGAHPLQDSILTPLSYKVALAPPREELIYIQYIQSYRQDEQLIAGILLKNGYQLQPSQLMKTGNFRSSVKYFNKEDAGAAARLANLINSSSTTFQKKPIRVLYQNLQAPPGQLEIWLGDIEKPDPEAIILNNQ